MLLDDNCIPHQMGNLKNLSSRTLADEVGDEMPHNMERRLPHRSKTVVYMLYCAIEKEKQELFCTKSHFLSYLEGAGAAHKMSKGTHIRSL